MVKEPPEDVTTVPFGVELTKPPGKFTSVRRGWAFTKPPGTGPGPVAAGH